MPLSNIIADIDSQIAFHRAELGKLEQARKSLSGITATERKGRGRPKGSKNVKTASSPTPKKTRNLSPEGRKRIAEAMKRRWAERRKQSAPAAK